MRYAVVVLFCSAAHAGGLRLDRTYGDEIFRFPARDFARTTDVIAASGPLDQIAVFDAKTGRVKARWGTGEDAGAIAISADATWIAVAGGYANVWLFDARTGKRLWESTAGRPDQLAFSPDRKRLIGRYGDWTFVWSTATGALIWKSERSHDRMGIQCDGPYDRALPDGRLARIAVTKCEYERAGDVTRSRPVKSELQIDGHAIATLSPVTAFATSPSGVRIAVATHDAIEVIEASGRRLAKISARVDAVYLSDDPDVVYGAIKGTLVAYDVAGERWQWPELGDATPQFAGKRAVVIVKSGRCTAIDPRTGAQLWERTACSRARPDATTVTLGTGGAFEVVDAHTGVSTVKHDVGPRDGIATIVADDHGAIAATWTEQWVFDDRGARALPATRLPLQSARVKRLGDGRIAAVGISGSDLVLARFRDEKLDGVNAIATSKPVIAVSFAGDAVIHEEPDGKRLVTTMDLTTVVAPAWQATTTLQGAVIDRAGTHAWTAGDHVGLRNLATGREDVAQKLQASQIAVSPDEAHAIVLGNHQLTVLDAHTLALEHRADVDGYQLAVGPAIAVTTHTGIAVVDLTGTKLEEITVPDPTAVAWSPDGKALWVGLRDGRVLRYTY
ncbi:MAG: PQQ-binding-like beta-propeller repeat protein [Kofleriaceae bacterium]